MAATNGLLSAGLVFIVMAVVLVIGGMLLVQTYTAGKTIVGVQGNVFSAVNCYQNSANETPACGNALNGTYLTTSWNVSAPSLASDNNTATYSADLCADGFNSNFTGNYRTPLNVTSADWVVKYTIESSTHTATFHMVQNTCGYIAAPGLGIVQVYVKPYLELNESCGVSFGCGNGTYIHWFNSVPLGPP